MKKQHTNFDNEIDEYHDKLDWQDITMLVIVGALVAWIIIRAMFNF